MKITHTDLEGLFLIQPTVHVDGRGFFMEVFNAHTFNQVGIGGVFVQHNQSHSPKNVIRGLHFQWDKPLGKLRRVVRGQAYMVAVDIRKNSPTRGKWEAREVSEENKIAFWAPFGFATGFCARTDNTDVEYYYSAFYNKDGESNIVWNDADFAIPWPIRDPILSERHAGAHSFREWLSRPESNFIT